MSKSGGTTSTTSSTAPATFQQPYIDQMLAESKKLYDSAGPSYFPNSMTAGFTAPETQAQSMLTGAVPGQQQQVANTALSNYSTLSNAADVNNNPYLQKAVEGATRPVWQQLTDYAMPQIRRSYEASGGLGSSRQGIAEGLATGRTAQSSLDTAAKMYSDAYGQGLNTQQSALSMAPSVSALQTASAETLSAVGAQQREMEQAKINEDVNRYTYNQNLPYNKLTDYANLVTKQLGGTGTSTVTAPESSALTTTLGGISTLLPLISSIWKLFQ